MDTVHWRSPCLGDTLMQPCTMRAGTPYEKHLSLPLPALALLVLVAAPGGRAGPVFYRCGNEYTNNANQARERGCKLVEGGNITVVEVCAVHRPAVLRPPQAIVLAAFGAARESQRPARARCGCRGYPGVRVAQGRSAPCRTRQEYNNGAPERNALDLRNTQRYAERTAEIKANLARSESDIAGIKRELARLPSP